MKSVTVVVSLLMLLRCVDSASLVANKTLNRVSCPDWESRVNRDAATLFLFSIASEAHLILDFQQTYFYSILKYQVINV